MLASQAFGFVFRRQRGKIVCIFEQKFEPLARFEIFELGDERFYSRCQGGFRHLLRQPLGCVPFTIGTPTVLPHSVQLPS